VRGRRAMYSHRRPLRGPGRSLATGRAVQAHAGSHTCWLHSPSCPRFAFLERMLDQWRDSGSRPQSRARCEQPLTQQGHHRDPVSRGLQNVGKRAMWYRKEPTKFAAAGSASHGCSRAARDGARHPAAHRLWRAPGRRIRDPLSLAAPVPASGGCGQPQLRLHPSEDALPSGAPWNRLIRPHPAVDAAPATTQVPKLGLDHWWRCSVCAVA
jgi:hypothetical protein